MYNHGEAQSLCDLTGAFLHCKHIGIGWNREQARWEGQTYALRTQELGADMCTACTC